MELHLYTFEDADGTEQDFSTQAPVEAQEYARDNHCRVIDNTYEFSDSEPVTEWDFRPRRFVVSDSEGVQEGEQMEILDSFVTEDDAAQFIDTLPGKETGRYNLDGPSDDMP